MQGFLEDKESKETSAIVCALFCTSCRFNILLSMFYLGNPFYFFFADQVVYAD